jgi:hypothetical protein
MDGVRMTVVPGSIPVGGRLWRQKWHKASLMLGAALFLSASAVRQLFCISVGIGSNRRRSSL